MTQFLTPVSETKFRANVIDAIPFPRVSLVASVTRTIDLTQQNLLDRIGDIMSIQVDASNASADIQVRNSASGNFLVAPAGTIGWYPFPIKKLASQIDLLTTADAVINLTLSTSPLIMPPYAVRGAGVRTSEASTTVLSASATAFDLVGVNLLRFGVTVENASTGDLFLLPGIGTPSISNRMLRIPSGGYYESPFNFGGRLRAVSASGATGSIFVTEFI